MKTRTRTYIILPCLTLMLAGCGSQASPDYVGQALITLSGSVEIEEAPEGGELRPALAFFNGETGTVHIVDVVVEGEFPSDFTLRVMEPPPDEAFFAGPDGIGSALGYITAVTADRPHSFRYGTQHASSGTCYETGESGEQLACDTQRWWCSGEGDDQECYGEWQQCLGGDEGGESCEQLGSVGDPALKDTWANFAGLSEDLVLVYLSDPLRAADDDAIRLGLPGLSPGYTLLEPQPEHDPDSEDGAACDERIERRAFELQEQKYQTGYTYDELLAQGGCGWENPDEWLPCDPRRHEIWDHTQDESGPQAAAEIGCRETGTWRIVEDPAREHISIRIGTGVRPSLFAPDRVSHTEEFTPSLTFDPLAMPAYEPYDPCAEPEVDAIGWTEQSPLGQAPEALFAALEGSCTSALRWHGGDAMWPVTPSSGATEVAVSLQFDRESARYLSFPSAPEGRCLERLEIDAELTVRTTDGAIDDTSTVTVLPGGRLHVLREIEEHGGTLDAEREEHETFFVNYMLGGPGESCTGSVSIARKVEDFAVHGELAIEGSAVGTWSNNGCEAGGAPMPLTEAIEGVGASAAELIERMFGDIELAGQWRDDGAAAQLQLSTTIAGEESVCAYGYHADVPVAVTYSTSDGTIAPHVTEGLVDLSWRDPEQPTARLSVADLLECEDSSATLAYTPADCSEQVRATITVHLRHDGSRLDIDDHPTHGLSVYLFDHGGVLDSLPEDFEHELWHPGHAGFNVESADHFRKLDLEL